MADREAIELEDLDPESQVQKRQHKDKQTKRQTAPREESDDGYFAAGSVDVRVSFARPERDF